MEDLYKDWGTLIEIIFSVFLGIWLQKKLKRLDRLTSRGRIYLAPTSSQVRADVVFEKRLIWIELIALAFGATIIFDEKAIVMLGTCLTAFLAKEVISTWRQDYNANTKWAVFCLTTFWMSILIGYFTEQKLLSILLVGLSFVIAAFSQRHSDRF